MLYYLFAIGIIGKPLIRYFADAGVMPAMNVTSNPYLVRADKGPDLANLPDLQRLSWPSLHRPNTSDPEASRRVKDFGVALSSGHRKTIEKLLDTFQTAMVAAKLNNQWFLFASTLIGSVRHHDVVPWGGSVVVAIDVRYRKRVGEILKLLGPRVEFHENGSLDILHLKTLSASKANQSDIVGSFKVKGNPWPWPFISIWYHENKTDGLATIAGNSTGIFRLEDVFPLTYRPLGSRWYPAPRRPVSVLQMYYPSNPWTCEMQDNLFSAEGVKSAKQKDCPDLADRYTFVQRCPHSFVYPKSEPDVRELLNSMVFADEHLIKGNEEIIHTIRIVINLGATAKSGFSARPRNYNCSAKR